MYGSGLFGVVLVGLSTTLGNWPDPDELIFRRGDANSDGAVNGADAVWINSFLFLQGPAPPCMNQADANNDGQVDVSDSVFLLNWLYKGGSQPPYPGPYNTVCTVDDLPRPGCAVDPCP